MPEVCYLLIGASTVAPLLLFLILAWNVFERRRALAATEDRVRLRARGAAVSLRPRPALRRIGLVGGGVAAGGGGTAA